MQKLGISGQQLQNVKLGPGVVGRNSSIAWALEVVMLAGVICGAIVHSPLLIGSSLVGAIVVALVIAILNVHFAKNNPAAAILEGAQFVEFHQMQMTASKGLPSPKTAEPPVPPSSQLSGTDQIFLPEKKL